MSRNFLTLLQGLALVTIVATIGTHGQIQGHASTSSKIAWLIGFIMIAHLYRKTLPHE